MTDLQIKYFIETAKSKSISAAANKLYVSQPSVSNQINALEKELGYKLFVRHSNGVTLTEAGKIAYNSLVRISVDWMTANNDARRIASSGLKKLRVGVLNLTFPETVKNRIVEFSKSDNVNIEMVSEDSMQLVSRVLNGTLDIGFCFDGHIENVIGLNSCSLLRTEYVFAMSPSHPFVKADTISREQISKQKFIFSNLSNFWNPDPEFESGNNTFVRLGNASKELGINPQLVQYSSNFESIFAQIEIEDAITVVDENVGLLCQPRFATRRTGIFHDYVAIWKSSNKNESLHALINYLCAAKGNG